MTHVGKVIRGLLKARMDVAIITLPEDGSRVGIRLLSDAEVAEASADAFASLTKTCRARDIDPGTFVRVHDDAFNRAQVHHMMLRAFRDPDAHDKSFFEDIEKIASLDVSYVNILWDAYLDHQNRKAPAKSASEDEVERVVASMIDEPAAEYVLAQLDAGSLIRIVQYVLKIARAADRKAD